VDVFHIGGVDNVSADIFGVRKFGG
jgi:hypothetical protein